MKPLTQIRGKIRLKPWHWGAGVAVVLILFALGGFWHAPGTGLELAFTLLFALTVGGLAFGLVDRRLWYLLLGLIAGIATGTASSSELYFGETFLQEFFVAEATLTFFIALGFGLGLLAEFISLLHFLLHRGRVWDYGRSAASSRTDSDAPPANQG